MKTKYNYDAITLAVTDLRENLSMPDDATISEVLKANVDAALTVFQAALTEINARYSVPANVMHPEWDTYDQAAKEDVLAQDEVRKAEEIERAMSPLSWAVEMFNDYARLDLVDRVRAAGYNDGMALYLESQTAAGWRITGNDEDGFSLEECDLWVKAHDVIPVVMSEAEMKGIYDAVSIFADNCAKVKAYDTDKSVVHGAAMKKSYRETAERMGWNLPASKLTKTALKAQFDEIIHMIFRGFEISTRSADVRWMMDGMAIPVDTANSAGKYRLISRQTALDLCFRAFYTCYHGEKYTIDATSLDCYEKAEK